jgi:hypothetical protein
VRDARRRWLAHGDYTLTVMPFRIHERAQSAVDRSTGVRCRERFRTDLPTLERGKLKNGIPSSLGAAPGAPVLDVVVQFARLQHGPRTQARHASSRGHD